MSDREDAVQAARDQTAAMTALADEVKRLRRFGRNNRKFIVVDVLLTLALAATGAVSVHATQTANSAAANNRSLCQSSNVARAQSIELWDYLLALPPAKGAAPPSAQQKERAAAFRAFLDKVYQPRDCAHVSPGNP